MTVVALLDMAVDGGDERVAVGSKDGGLTARELRKRASAVAALFRHANVAFIGENSDALPVALLAATRAGLPFAPLNYRLTDDRLDAIVQRLAPATVIAAPEQARRLSTAGIDILHPDLLRDGGTGAPDVPDVDVDPDAVAVLLFTSGTTGEPKAALLRQRHLFAYIVGTVEFMGASRDEAVLVSVPPYHIAGMSTILSSLYSGRRIVYLPAFDAEAWVRTAVAEAVTHAMVVPTMLSRLLDVIEAQDARLPALRHLSYGGGRMPVEVIERGTDAAPPRRLRERVRPHGDELDHRRARTRRSPRRSRERRPVGAQPVALSRTTGSGHRGRDTRGRRDRGTGR